MYKNIYLKRGKEDSLRRYHPWVFSGAIQRMDDGIGEGDIVRVITHSGDFHRAWSLSDWFHSGTCVVV